jgi:hypothetical protein
MEAQQVEVAQNEDNGIEWRVIAGHDNYEVSNTGLARNGRNQHILTPQTRRGYLSVKLGRDGRRSPLYDVHRLVATAFIGDSEGRQVDHIDRNRSNNNVSNLRYVSASDNSRNTGSHRGYAYEFLDELPADAITVEEWNGHRFEGLYYIGNGEFVIFNGVQFRKMPHVLQGGTAYYVQLFDAEHHHRSINIAKYRLSIDDVPIAEPNDEDNIIN